MTMAGSSLSHLLWRLLSLARPFHHHDRVLLRAHSRVSPDVSLSFPFGARWTDGSDFGVRQIVPYRDHGRQLSFGARPEMAQPQRNPVEVTGTLRRIRQRQRARPGKPLEDGVTFTCASPEDASRLARSVGEFYEALFQDLVTSKVKSGELEQADVDRMQRPFCTTSTWNERILLRSVIQEPKLRTTSAGV